jgi:hypothetical protein
MLFVLSFDMTVLKNMCDVFIVVVANDVAQQFE